MLETMKCKAKVSSLQVFNYKQYNDGVIDWNLYWKQM